MELYTALSEVRWETPDDDNGCVGRHILMASQAGVNKVAWRIFWYSKTPV